MNRSKLGVSRVAATLGAAAAGIVALSVSAADVTSYSYPDGIVFTGGGPAAGQFVADTVVVTRTTQFARYGRAGHLEPLDQTRYADAAVNVMDGAGGPASLKVVRSHEDKRYPRLVDRLGRE